MYFLRGEEMLKHKGTLTIETVRLILRRFDEQDAEQMFKNWASDPEVCKFLSWGPHGDINVTKARIRHIVERYQYDNSYNWIIYSKRINEVIGSISVEISNERSCSCEMGYCLGREHWNQGLMTEAMRAIMHYLYFEIGYETIQAKHDTMNIASGRVMQKAGMVFEKIEYQCSRRKDGSLCDCAVYTKHIWDL